MKLRTSFSEHKKDVYKRMLLSGIAILFVLPIFLPLAEGSTEETLIIYYSRTGKTKIVSETLQKNLGAEMLEIHDPKDRSGAWGYIISSIDAFSHKHTPIQPENLDLSTHEYIIIATPIWSWNLSTPIHTLFEKNRFDGKKIILITTANIHIMKYEQYGDDASFIKRFLRDYLREKRKAAASEVENSGGDFIGHYHITTKEKTDQEIIDETMKAIDYVKKTMSQQ
jgi:flavodoxin